MHVTFASITCAWSGVGSEGGDWGDRPSETYECNFFHHVFMQFGKQDLRNKAILSSNVWSP